MNNRTNAVLVVAILAIATLPIAGPSPAARAVAGRAGASRTAVHVVDPVTATGIASGFRIVKRVTGWCWTGSEPIVGAHRCITNSSHRIHDPCWFDPAVSNRHVVVCPVNPWSRRLIRLHSRTRLPRYAADRIHRADPWGVTLANGWRCVFSEGARDSFHGKTVNWDCGRHPGRHYHHLGGIYGSLHRGDQPWRASVAVWHPKAGRYTNGGPVTVTAVWYGKVHHR